MKKILLIVLVCFFLTGCNGIMPNPSEEEVPVEEISVEIIRKYLEEKDKLVRWADGNVIVLDETGKNQDFYNQINSIINGPVVFKIKDDISPQEANIWIHNDTKAPAYSFTYEYHFDKNCYEYFEISFNSDALEKHKWMYDYACLITIGINPFTLKKEMIYPELDKELRIVLYWLHRLEPGLPLK